MRITVLTGAGISAESGLPTFRDHLLEDGNTDDPYDFSSVHAWNHHPERVWSYYLWLYWRIRESTPSIAHYTIAHWHTHLDHDVRVITQNIDTLHERAGSSPVYHLHGNVSQFFCSRCHSPYLGPLPFIPKDHRSSELVYCSQCHGIIRPNIVLFGEPLPDQAWQHSRMAVGTAELMIVVGTSSVVYPAAGLPELALQHHVPVIEINPHCTPLSDQVTCSIRQTAATALPDLLTHLPKLLKNS